MSIQLKNIKQDTIVFLAILMNNKNTKNINLKKYDKLFTNSEKIAMSQNYLGILSTVVMKDTLLTFSSFKDGQLKSQYTSPNNKNDQIKLQLLSNNGFLFIILDGTYVQIFKFNKYFQYIGDQSKFSLQSSDQKFIQFQDDKLIFFGYNNYELNEYVQIIDIYEKKNQYDEIETSQLIKIRNINLKNLHQLKIEYIEQNKYLLMWLTNYYYHYELNIQQIDLGIQLQLCQQNCIKCNKDYQCSKCQDGYLLDTINNKYLLQCVDNCQIYSNPDYCDECQSGYLQTIEALCVQQQNPNYLKLNLNSENPGKQRMLQMMKFQLSIQQILINLINQKYQNYHYEFNYNSLTFEFENYLQSKSNYIQIRMLSLYRIMQCQQCKNSNYNLLNGKCQGNCQVCNDELKCLQCKLSYFLNSLDECIDNQLGQIVALENQIRISYQNQGEVLLKADFNQNISSKNNMQT